MSSSSSPVTLVRGSRSPCIEIPGTDHFETLPQQPEDNLAAHALSLNKHFYGEALLDEGEWGGLVLALLTAGRPERAAHTREKLRRLQSVRNGTALDRWMAKNGDLLKMLENK